MLWSRWPIYSTVLCNLHDGTAIRGVLIEQRGPLIVLAKAALLAPGEEPAPMDGQVYIERAQVQFLQRLEG